MKNAHDHLKVPQMEDVQLVKFLMFNTTKFVTTDANNFNYIRAISDVMLHKVLASNKIISIYKQIPKPDEENTVSDVRIDDYVNDDDSARSSNPKNLKQPYTKSIQTRTTNPESSQIAKVFVVSTNTSTPIHVQTENVFFLQNIINEPIVNLSQTQSPPVPHISPLPTTSQPQTTTIQYNTTPSCDDDDDEFAVTDDDEVEVISSFQPFVELVIAPSLVDDESDLDDTSVVSRITKKEYQLLNKKLNVLVRRADSFSPTNIQNLMLIHENSMKPILSENERLFDAQEKLISDSSVKVNEALSKAAATLSKVDYVITEGETLKESIISVNLSHHQTVVGALNTLVDHYYT
ncbi:unnamed protein product [Lactuca virosa]|uniref:Uncharacterized protein n=1 Tax=Lactuca virosa TaxID=75947 RepID=A0AAU9PIK4_9ASTR|nr:unnamed protein product [Lactuca virosa]